MSNAETARQLLTLESRAVRRLRATAKLTVEVVGPTNSETLIASALSVQMGAAVRDIRTTTRAAAAKQFSEATSLSVAPSGADDSMAAVTAAAAYVRAWRAAYAGGGGTTVGGGSTDAWNDARLAVHPKIDRIASWEVMHAWNDEHRRNADALPEYRFREKWCAILDTHLCPRCRAMNGRLADVNGTFAQGWPPLHPDCRCFIVTTVI